MFGPTWWGDSSPHLLLMHLMQVPDDDGEPKKFHPLDSFAPEDFNPLDTFVPKDFLATQKDFITITALSPILSIDEESLLDKEPWLAQFNCITGSLACSHPMPVLNLPCTIYWESPCPSIKSCHNDADRESKDCDLLVSNLLAVFSTTGGHVFPVSQLQCFWILHLLWRMV